MNKAAMAEGRKKYWKKRKETMDVKMSISQMIVLDYAKLDCNCIVRIVHPYEKSPSFRPLSIIDNTDCELYNTKEDTFLRNALEVLDNSTSIPSSLLGGWVVNYPGTKKHRPGYWLTDGGMREGVRLDPKKLYKKWKQDIEEYERETSNLDNANGC